MKLYELTGQYLKLSQDLSDAEDGTPLVDIMRLFLADTKDAIETKVENIGKVILTMDSERDAIEAEISRLSKRSASLANRRDGLKQYLLTEMVTLGADKIRNPLFAVSVRNNPPSVSVLDINAIPVEFRRVIPATWEVDKRLIIDNFKATGEIPSGTEIIRDKKSLMIK